MKLGRYNTLAFSGRYLLPLLALCVISASNILLASSADENSAVLLPAHKSQAHVIPRLPVLENGDYFPCDNCHDGEDPAPNPVVRELVDEHETLEFKHGGGRFWCTTCHSPAGPNFLHDIEGNAVSFNESYKVCGQCHFKKEKDIFGGGHGKRIGNWQGEKTILNCPACHNPHAPKILPRKPMKGPTRHTQSSSAHPLEKK